MRPTHLLRLVPLAALMLGTVAYAKGPTPSMAIYSLESPWMTWRAGETVEVRARLDLEAACERWNEWAFGGAVPEEALDQCEDMLQTMLDGVTSETVYLVPANGEAKPGTYIVAQLVPWQVMDGEPVFRATIELPVHWPSGGYRVSPFFGQPDELADPRLLDAPVVKDGLTVLSSGWEDAAAPQVVAVQIQPSAPLDGHLGIAAWVDDDASKVVVATATLRRPDIIGQVPANEYATIPMACEPCGDGPVVRSLCQADRPARVGLDWSAPGEGEWEVVWVEVRDAAGRHNLYSSTVLDADLVFDVTPAPSEEWGPVLTPAGELVAEAPSCSAQPLDAPWLDGGSSEQPTEGSRETRGEKASSEQEEGRGPSGTGAEPTSGPIDLSAPPHSGCMSCGQGAAPNAGWTTLLGLALLKTWWMANH